jgi:inner membrane transporter RhtA
MTTTAVPPATSAATTGPARRPGVAVLLVLGSCSSLQGGAALAVRLFPVTGTAGATLLRVGLAAAVLLVAVRPRVRAWTASQWRAVVLYGLSIAGTNGFFYAALARLPLGTAVTIQFLGPLTLSAVLSRRPRDVGWVLLAVAGVLTLGLAGSGGAHHLSGAGVAFVLVSAAFWALYIVAGGRLSAAVPGRGGLAAGITVGAVALLPVGAAGAWHAAARPPLLLTALGVALLASVVPYTLELAAMRQAPRRVFGILLSLEPAVATLSGWLLLGQRVPPAAVAAVVLVVLASTGSALSAREPAEVITSG